VESEGGPPPSQRGKKKRGEAAKVSGGKKGVAFMVGVGGKRHTKTPEKKKGAFSRFV